MIFIKKLDVIRYRILNIGMISKFLGWFWWLIPNQLRLRLPIRAIAYGLISPLKIFRWTLDPRDLISQKYFGFGFRKYEKCTQRALFEEIKKIGKQKKVNFLNIGANTGLYALLVSKKFPETIITLFEPIPLNLKFLYKNMALNRLTPKIFDVAASDSNGIAQIYSSEDYFGMASFDYNNSFPIEVKIFRVDDLIDSEMDVVLIDVEGHELEVLKGMDKMLRNFGPTLIVETDNETIDKLAMFLEVYEYGQPVWLGVNKIFGPQEKNFLFRKIT